MIFLKNPLWLLFYPIVCLGLDRVVQMVRFSMAREFVVFPYLVILALISLIFVGLSFVISLYLTRYKAGVIPLLFLLALGLYAWLYPFLPPQLSFRGVLYGFNSYTSLSGALLIILSGWKIFHSLYRRNKVA